MARRNEEISVLGSVIIDPSKFAVIDRVGLTADDFDLMDTRLAFETLMEMREHGDPIDATLLTNKMAKGSESDYEDFLREVITYTPTAHNALLYAQIVKEAAEKRRYSQALTAATEALYGGDWRDEADNLAALMQTLHGVDYDVADGGKLGDVFSAYYQQVKENPDKAYCKTGIADIDRQLGGGMFRSEVYIIGARPGMGKTTLGINIAQSIVKRGQAVLFCSMEMTAPQIQAKRISLETGVPYTNLIAGRLDVADEIKMESWISESKNAPFYLTTRSDLTVSDIGRRARQVPDVSCIIIDYLGLVRVPQSSVQKPRYEQMTEISADVKALAKNLNIPILALCQLNRENTSRSDKRPTMADLRDSGAIEQDAGAIILLHRPDYYNQKDEPPPVEEIELNVAKNRHAEPGVVHMFWNGANGKISMISNREEEAPKREDVLPF